jgi:RES domain-containing protein
MKTPDLIQLTHRFQALLPMAVAMETVGYRSVTPKYAQKQDILSGEGSRKSGGRWNPPGMVAVYLSLTPEIAMAETLAHFHYRGIPVAAAMPRVFVAVTARLKRVLNITRGTIRQRLQISEQSLMNVDWRKEMAQGRTPVSQLVGQAAQAAGVEGLLVPSAAFRNGRNLIIFPPNLLSGSRISVDRADELPKDAT